MSLLEPIAGHCSSILSSGRKVTISLLEAKTVDTVVEHDVHYSMKKNGAHNKAHVVDFTSETLKSSQVTR